VIKVYRLSHRLALANYPDPFRPKQTNNRWNSKIVQIAYTSEHLALAAIELLSYWQSFASLQGYKIFSYQLKASQIVDLCKDANIKLSDKQSTVSIGDNWASQSTSLALKVPSIVLPYSCNYLINPNHPDYHDSNVADLGDFNYEQRIINLISKAKSL